MTPTEEKAFDRELVLALKPVLDKWGGERKWFISKYYTQDMDRKVKFIQLVIADEATIHPRPSDEPK